MTGQHARASYLTLTRLFVPQESLGAPYSTRVPHAECVHTHPAVSTPPLRRTLWEHRTACPTAGALGPRGALRNGRPQGFAAKRAPR